MIFCSSSSSSPVAFYTQCVRETWAALLPISFICLLAILRLIDTYVPIPPTITSLFKDFLTLREAEALDKTEHSGSDTAGKQTEKPRLLRTVLISFLSLSLSLAWLGIGTYRLATSSPDWSSMSALAIAVCHLYAASRPVVKPFTTPPYDLFALIITQLIGAVLLLGGTLYEESVYGVKVPVGDVVALAFNLAIVTALLGIVMLIPMATRSNTNVCSTEKHFSSHC